MVRTMIPRRFAPSRHVWSVVLSALTLVMTAAPAFAGQSTSASELKAAFVFNFVRFTDWPADVIPAGAPIVTCLLEDGAIADTLRQLVKGRTVGTHGVEARVVSRDEARRGCHVLYVSGLDLKRSDELVASLQDSAILTISDDERFAERGGIANFFIQNDNMGFAVNILALQRARLQLSAKVLALARIVRK
jgi:hypothetical protein